MDYPTITLINLSKDKTYSDIKIVIGKTNKTIKKVPIRIGEQLEITCRELIAYSYLCGKDTQKQYIKDILRLD